MSPLRPLVPPVPAVAAAPPDASSAAADSPEAASASLDGDGAPQVPRDTSPTWELELLISGAVIFALLQLPPLVESARDWLEPRLSLGLFGVNAMVAVYVRGILYALIVTFVLHLSARAYWVALVGLDSVFPAGVAWDRLKVGPIGKQVYRERLPRLSAVIARTDNVCSVMFALGFLTAFMFGFSLVSVGGVALVALGVSELVLGGRHLFAVFGVLSALFLGLPMLGAAVDKLGDGRISPDGRVGRVVRRLSAWNYLVTLQGVYGHISMTLFSNVRKSLIYPVFYLFFFGLLAVVFLEDRARQDDLKLDSYAFVPDAPGAFGVDGRFYEDQRGDDHAYATVPFVQSDVVRGPYVRLFIPYVPFRHNPALAAGCPGAAADPPRGADTTLTPDERRAAATLACLTRIHRVQVNGAARPDLELRFHVHPGTGMKGMLAYIPVAGLPRGRNVLTVQRPPNPPNPFTGKTAPTARPHTIPFWL